MVLISLILPACASTSSQSGNPPAKDHIVVGSGTSDDQTTIVKSNQQIFNAEHALSPNPSAASSNQGVP